MTFNPFSPTSQDSIDLTDIVTDTEDLFSVFGNHGSKSSKTGPLPKPVPTPPSQKRKRVALPLASIRFQRGRNWSEKDSILLVKAFNYAEENKKGTHTSNLTCLMFESLGVKGNLLQKNV